MLEDFNYILRFYHKPLSYLVTPDALCFSFNNPKTLRHYALYSKYDISDQIIEILTLDLSIGRVCQII